MKQLCQIAILLTGLGCLLITGHLRAATPPDSLKHYRDMVNRWNDAHNNWRFSQLGHLYADKVLFYCSTIGKQECIGYKTGLASPTKIFFQAVLSEIKVTAFGKGIAKCEFIKEVTIDDKKARYPAYLLIKTINDSLKIIAESDEITDASFGFRLGPELFESRAPAYNNGRQVQDSGAGFRTLAYYGGPALLILILALVLRRRKKNKGQTTGQISKD